MSKLTTSLKYYGIVTTVYVLLTLLLPANHVAQHDYRLSSSGYHILLFLVILPLLGIWFGAYYSYARLQQYSKAIVKTPEGSDFHKLTRGFVWIAWGSVITAIVTALLNAISNDQPGFHPSAIIITNYASLIVPLVGYNLISGGSHGLNIRAKISISSTNSKILVMLFMLIGVAYCFITFQHLDLSSINSSDNPYYLPAWLMILSVVVPYLYTWFIGFLAAYEMYLYSKHVDGVLYQRAIRQLSYGVIGVIVSSIVVQYLRSAIPRTGHLSLNTLLLIINIVYIFMAAGYIFLSLGARQLRKIEEV